MAVKKKAVGSAGALVLIALVVIIKLLGGPDLLGGLDGGGDNTAGDARTGDVLIEAPKARTPGSTGGTTSSASQHESEDTLLEQLYRDEVSDEMITLVGVVSKSLPDDNEGSRHQKFILKVASGRTILIAHNIDLAERVPLREGDTITLRGEYEWTERGGTVHWTHHDPKKWREGGWIEHNGIRYE